MLEGLYDRVEGENSLIDLVCHFLNKFDDEGFCRSRSFWAKIRISGLAERF